MRAQKGIIDKHNNGFNRRIGFNQPELFNRKWWKSQEVWATLMDLNIPRDKSILDIGCLTGEILANLWIEGYDNLCGIDIVPKAIVIAMQHRREVKGHYVLVEGFFEDATLPGMGDYDYIISSDCLEHVHNLGLFFDSMLSHGAEDFVGVLIVPKGTNFCDEGHVNFWPTVQCFNNLLDYHFNIIKSWESSDRITAIVGRKK